jgi:epoxide hydrolase
VCPSLPGFGFSDKPTEPGWGIERIAHAWTELMARLGYPRYGAQGSDWGTSVSTLIAQQDPAHVVGIHLTPPLAPPDPATFDDLTDAERAALAALEHAAAWDSGYSTQHATRPQTIGYGLVDSPAGPVRVDHREVLGLDRPRRPPRRRAHPRPAARQPHALRLPGTGASSARLYWESIRQVNEWVSGAAVDTVTAPTGCSIFPKELQRPSRRWAERRFVDIRYWNEPDRGGHFAAFEQPQLFVDEVRAFFRLVRQPT